MAIIECRGLYKDYAGTVILESVDLTVQRGEKLGLVGPNGAGKTTLLNALSGADEDYRGSRIADPDLRIGYLAQHIEPPEEETALEYLVSEACAAREKLRASEEALSGCAEGGSSRFLHEYEKALQEYEAVGGDFAEERASRALALVGLPGREKVRAASLSGGERGTLALARALQGNPNLLILDEPGNHLDFWGMAWLEDFIAGFPAAAIIVSHNRMLLDRTASRIVELENGRLNSFTGDYSAYRLAKLRKAAAQGADWQASRKRIERLELMVSRAATLAAAFTKHQAKSNGSLGQRLRARRRQLERAKAESIDKPNLGSSAITASFCGRGAAEVKSDFALIVKGYSKSFGERLLFKEGSFDLYRGERVALVGPNGCGKTTFLRELVDRGSWDSESLRVSPGMRIGYVAQDRDGFNKESTVREELESLGAKEHDVRNLLRDFGFGRGDPDRRVGTLSGGELNRLQLARAIWTGANFLVLDEPTNHLDIDARESVEDRLAEYDGTMLLVSHDRYFLEKVAERIIYVEDAEFRIFEGSFSEFWAELGANLRPGAVGTASRNAENAMGRARAINRARAAANGGRPAKSASGREEDSIEGKIIAMEGEKAGLEARIKNAFGKRDYALARRLSNELQEMHREIERLYARWT